MKKITATCVSAVALAAFAAPASAEVVTGPRVEVMVGYDHTRVTLEEEEDFDENFKTNGLMFGVGVGYDFAFSENVAIGLDLEATESQADEEVEEDGDRAELNAGRDLYAGVRITLGQSEGGNIYIKGGYTNYRIGAVLDVDDEIVEDSTDLDGVRAGVGAQLTLGTRSYIAIEYRYSNYERDVDRHQGLIGVGFRF